VSRNGKWAAGEYQGVLQLVNTATGDVQVYEGDGMTTMYSIGNGTAIADDGTIAGSTNGNDAAVLADGVWTQLSCGSGDPSAVVYLANDISADASIICGGVGSGDIMDEEQSMIYPCVWERQANGTWSEPIMLPCPERDFAGRVPQYIIPVSMSADGNRILGQMTDYSGFEHQPLLFERVEGEWTCTAVAPDLINPGHVEFPEYPGEAPQYPDENDYLTTDQRDAYDKAVTEYNAYFGNKPKKEEFMSDDSRLDYQDALEAYYADPDNNPYPMIDNFMTEDEKAAYNQAVDDFYANAPARPAYEDFMSEENKTAYLAAQEEFQTKYDAWDVAYSDFMAVFEEVLAQCPNYIFNNISISPDGTKGVTTGDVVTYDPMSWSQTSEVSVYTFDLVANTATKIASPDNIIARQIVDSGILICNSYPGVAVYNKTYVLKPGTSEFVSIETYYAENGDTDAVQFIADNMTHDIESFDMETNEPVILSDQIVTGISCVSSDMTMLVSWTESPWGYDSDTYYCSYIIKGKQEGVGAAVAEAATTAELAADGTLTVNGPAANVTVYDVNGRVVYTVDAPAGAYATGLGHGAYIVRVNGATTITLKAVI